ncbi:Cytochrome c oxidase subunit II [Candidatus Magnetaquicoccaceae bacterium FCR-1]|uniref:Cytochrome c oxidase subunit II n=1 Tax=Candidatus Magnetaquiglobus chichijimensis TaxID=3141448 RepID=A0ABQ0C7H7_9PROT
MKRAVSAMVLMGLGSAAALAEAGAKGGIPDPAASWNHLWHDVLLDLFIIGIIFLSAGLYWVWKYRADRPNQLGTAPKFDKITLIGLAVVPSFLFMADDFYLAAKGWTVWNEYRDVPRNAMEVKVTGSMWNWNFEYDNGVSSSFMVDSKEGDGLVVPVGKPVVLRMTSTDVVHSFFLPEYRVKEDLMPGRVTYLWFNPVKAGETIATCAEYCGNRHSFMWTKVKMVPQAEFDAWVAQKKQGA